MYEWLHWGFLGEIYGVMTFAEYLNLKQHPRCINNDQHNNINTSTKTNTTICLWQTNTLSGRQSVTRIFLKSDIWHWNNTLILKHKVPLRYVCVLNLKIASVLSKMANVKVANGQADRRTVKRTDRANQYVLPISDLDTWNNNYNNVNTLSIRYEVPFKNIFYPIYTIMFCPFCFIQMHETISCIGNLICM